MLPLAQLRRPATGRPTASPVLSPLLPPPLCSLAAASRKGSSVAGSNRDSEKAATEKAARQAVVYLWEEWKERHPESASDCSDKFLNLRFISLELPQQDNSYDCGLFLLHYVELFLMDTPRSLNPMKIDSFSSFLSDDWFPPAEASLKRSLIRKLIHELLREPSQDYPKLVCCSEQLDIPHQRSAKAEQEQAKELPAGEPDLLCTILGTQQPSTSICFNDSDEMGAPVSECISENGRVSTATEHNLHDLVAVCSPDKDTVICLSSQDEKNEPPLADLYNQLDMTSCASEGPEAFKGSAVVVKDKISHKGPLLDSLDNNQNMSIQTDAEVHETMDSRFCSISNDAELMASEENSLERNTNGIEDEHSRASEDIVEPVMMLDGSKGDSEPDTERTIGKADVDINKDAADRSLDRNFAETEDIKCQGTLVDHVQEEDAILKYTKETSTTTDETNDNEQNVSSELKEGDTGNGMTGTVSCEMEERNIENVMAGDNKDGTGETHADGQDAHDNFVTGETVPCGDNTAGITGAEVPLVDNTSDAKRPLPDSTYEEDIPDGNCLQGDDAQVSDAKMERRYKRRKSLVDDASSLD
ncbi:hypothetical protein GUJ93_ZPchr0010g8220 [Zizania palustris]|uniref:Ubiquitin-like protease family profile domain-containing protein n=1 Tax=Zizania palustris TaxID=103762 RepID=A0A8J5W7X2_ZIZPA|nr:hypothetical protein GUJ93_ZPchr0010g8220 [Zizania palustris]